jgi:hypothetical protein
MWRPPRRSHSPRCPAEGGPAAADWTDDVHQPPERDEPVTDEPDPAVPVQDRRARLRVVGDDPAPAAAPAGDPDGPVDLMDPVDRARRVDDGSVDDGPVDNGSVDDQAVDDEAREWAWVAEWRDSGEPAPWATGLPLAAFAALLAAVAIWVLSAGLADRPVLAVALNLLVAGGLVPAMWLSRNLPVLRWFALGAAVGVVSGWIAALMML